MFTTLNKLNIHYKSLNTESYNEIAVLYKVANLFIFVNAYSHDMKEMNRECDDDMEENDKETGEKKEWQEGREDIKREREGGPMRQLWHVKGLKIFLKSCGLVFNHLNPCFRCKQGQGNQCKTSGFEFEKTVDTFLIETC